MRMYTGLGGGEGGGFLEAVSTIAVDGIRILDGVLLLLYLLLLLLDTTTA